MDLPVDRPSHERILRIMTLAPRLCRYGFAVLAAVMPSSGGDHRFRKDVAEVSPQDRACARAATWQHLPREVSLREPVAYPCAIRVSMSNVRLRADADGRVAGIGQQVFRAPDGSYGTYSTFGEIAVWSPTGQFVRTIGRRGEGPGEFARGRMTLHFDNVGRLYVRDNNFRWTLFTSKYELVGTASASGMGHDAAKSTFLDDGTFLTAQGAGQAADFTLFVFDFGARGESNASSNRPALRARLARARADEEALPSTGRDRLVAYAGGDSVWVGPTEGGSRGYEVELWRTDGALIRTLRRSVSWFRAPGDNGSPGARVALFHADSSGLLFLGIVAPTAQWRPPNAFKSVAEYRAVRRSMFDMRYEVIDLRDGRVLASSGPISMHRAVSEFPVGMFRGGMTGYVHREGASGLSEVVIVDIRLEQR
jgi:hypothetical protein